MGFFFNLKLNSMDDLLLHEIKDLYDAENRISEAIPLMADAASDPALKKAFHKHLQETKVQISRLEEIFHLLGEEPTRETCDAIKGLVAEGNELISAEGDADVKDAALIAVAQRVEHYEIASYGSARTFAQHLEEDKIVKLLEASLEEEKKTDVSLTKLAESKINIKAETK